MAARDHRHLQRRGAHVVLADGRLARSAARRGRSGKRLRAWRIEVLEVRAGRSRTSRPARAARRRRARARSSPNADVAGDLERLGQRDLVAAAGAAVLVGQVGGRSAAGRARRRRGPWCPGCTCPLSSAAAAVTSLNVEPGRVASPAIARLSIGLSGSSLSRFVVRPDLVEVVGGQQVRVVRRVATTIARIAPVAGSIATTAPCMSSPSAAEPVERRLLRRRGRWSARRCRPWAGCC